MKAADLLHWLGEREPAPPTALRARLERVVDDSAEPLPEHLARLGRELLAAVAARPDGGRDLALDLLAADAFVTYAFEAQADSGVGGLAALAAATARDGASTTQ
jgi:hypothetical protein